MKPRFRAAGEPQSSASSDGVEGSPVGAFRVDARVGHAWFARPAKPMPVAKRGSAMLPALRKAELILAGQGRAIARRATRVPAEAIVQLGSALSAAGDRRRAATPAEAAANDNAGARAGTALREIAFLLIFCATLAGTYFLGRAHASATVISVPDSVSGATKVVAPALRPANAG